MVEQQGLNADLEKIYKGIKPLDVRQFVGDHCLQLFLRESGESGYRQKDDRAKPSNHGWSLQPLAFAVGDRAPQTETALHGAANLE